MKKVINWYPYSLSLLTASEALDSLDHVNCFAEIHGDKQMNVMLNELIGKVETLKLQNVRLSTILSICCKLSSCTIQL